MTKFKSKPRIVEAEQYSLHRHIKEDYLPAGVVRYYFADEYGVQHEGIPKVGAQMISDTDWVVLDNGAYRVFSDEAFRALHDPIPTQTQTVS